MGGGVRVMDVVKVMWMWRMWCVVWCRYKTESPILKFIIIVFSMQDVCRILGNFSETERKGKEDATPS